jgi:aminoglycoside phosphotransferase (APT) family kinase protein
LWACPLFDDAAQIEMDTLPRIRQAMPLLARLHDALEHANLPHGTDEFRFGNYLAAADITTKTAAGVRRIRSLTPSLNRVADAAEAVADELAATPTSTDPLPPQWCHGDYWDNNVLFRDRHVVLVTDFGFMNRRRRVDDLALTLYFALGKLDAAAHPDPSAELAALVNAYDSGARHPSPMTNETHCHLPSPGNRCGRWACGPSNWMTTLQSLPTSRDTTQHSHAP